MKIIIQLVLTTVLIITIFFFYNFYFSEEKASKVEIVNKSENTKINKNDQANKSKNQGNEITNLKYNVELVNNGKYEITSSLSKIDIQNNVEIVLMENVKEELLFRIFQNNYPQTVFTLNFLGLE